MKNLSTYLLGFALLLYFFKEQLPGYPSPTPINVDAQIDSINAVYQSEIARYAVGYCYSEVIDSLKKEWEAKVYEAETVKN